MHADVQRVIAEYRQLLDKELPGLVEGIYLQGSVALDAYVPGRSDIDFITVVSRRLTEEEIARIKAFHQEMDSQPGLDGYYIMQGIEGDIPYFNEGKFHMVSTLNPVEKWMIKHKGITITGPEIPFDVSVHELLSYIQENSATYWAGRILMIEQNKESLKHLTKEKIDEEIEWSVLGMLRQYFSLKEHDIISKLDAGYFALQHLPESYHLLIKEAIAIREGGDFQHVEPVEKRIDEALKLLTFIHSECQRLYTADNRIRS